MTAPIYKDFKKRRLFRRNLGMVLIVFGLLLLLAIRFRMRFPGALWIELIGGIAALAAGWFLFATAYRPPTRAVLVLAEDRRAALTPGDLVVEMDLEIEEARAVLRKMEREGLLSKAADVEAYLLIGQAPRKLTK